MAYNEKTTQSSKKTHTNKNKNVQMVVQDLSLQLLWPTAMALHPQDALRSHS